MRVTRWCITFQFLHDSVSKYSGCHSSCGIKVQLYIMTGSCSLWPLNILLSLMFKIQESIWGEIHGIVLQSDMACYFPFVCFLRYWTSVMLLHHFKICNEWHMADNAEGRTSSSSSSSSYLFLGFLEVYKHLLSWFRIFSLFVIFVEHKTCEVSVYHTPVKTAVLWCVTSCIVMYMHQHFTETCLHLLFW